MNTEEPLASEVQNWALGVHADGSWVDSPKAINHPRNRALAELAREGYVHRPDAPFQLASGQTSTDYVDCRAALSKPQLLDLMSVLMLGELRQPITAVGGLTQGADPLAIAMSLAAYKSKALPDLRWFSVRREAKGHGLKSRFVGSITSRDEVLIVDDVVSTGGSIIQAIWACRGLGCVVRQVLGVVDRQMGGLETIQKVLDKDPRNEARASALFTLDELKAAA